jgi:diguanylate cyclase (GGDEF)-like protein
MVPDPFLEEDFRLLTPEAFEFVLTNELKRAVRSQNFVTLVRLATYLRNAPGSGNGERDEALLEIARLVAKDVRETDLLSRTGHGELSLVLLDADLESAERVIDRLMGRLNHYQFKHALTFDVGAACCPTHGIDADSLRRAAEGNRVRRLGDQREAQ